MLRVGGACGPPPPVAAPLASSLRAPSRGDPPLKFREWNGSIAFENKTPFNGSDFAPPPEGSRGGTPGEKGRSLSTSKTPFLHAGEKARSLSTSKTPFLHAGEKARSLSTSKTP